MKKIVYLQKFFGSAALLTAFVLGAQDANAQLSSKGTIIKNARTGTSHFNEFPSTDGNARVFNKFASADLYTPVPYATGLSAISKGTIAIGGHGAEKGYRYSDGSIAKEGSFVLADGAHISAKQLAERLLRQKDNNGRFLFNGENIFLTSCNHGRLTGEDSFGMQFTLALDEGLKDRGVSGGFTGYVHAANGVLISSDDKGGKYKFPDGRSYPVDKSTFYAVADRPKMDERTVIHDARYLMPIILPGRPHGNNFNHEAFTAYFVNGVTGGATLRQHKEHVAQPEQNEYSTTRTKRR